MPDVVHEEKLPCPAPPPANSYAILLAIWQILIPAHQHENGFVFDLSSQGALPIQLHFKQKQGQMKEWEDQQTAGVVRSGSLRARRLTMFLIPDCLLPLAQRGRDETKDIGKENWIQIYCFIAIQESKPESNHWTLESLNKNLQFGHRDNCGGRLPLPSAG